MFQLPCGEEIARHFSRYALRDQAFIMDGGAYKYKVIGGKYCQDDDRVFIELDPNYIAEADWRSVDRINGDGFPIKPTKIIFNGPATIVFWTDGTKTVVKCTERETFDYEKGVALCYMKRLLGNDSSFKRIFKKFNVPKQYRGYDDHYIEKLMDKEHFMKVLKSNFRKV